MPPTTDAVILFAILHPEITVTLVFVHLLLGNYHLIVVTISVHTNTLHQTHQEKYHNHDDRMLSCYLIIWTRIYASRLFSLTPPLLLASVDSQLQ